jgi:hypothetical protein
MKDSGLRWRTPRTLQDSVSLPSQSSTKSNQCARLSAVSSREFGSTARVASRWPKISFLLLRMDGVVESWYEEFSRGWNRHGRKRKGSILVTVM